MLITKEANKTHYLKQPPLKQMAKWQWEWSAGIPPNWDDLFGVWSRDEFMGWLQSLQSLVAYNWSWTKDDDENWFYMDEKKVEN